MTQIRIATLYSDLTKRIAELRNDKDALLRSREVVEKALGDGQTYYGINTGFGVLANVKIRPDQLEALQENLLLSHAVGLGSYIPREICKLMLQLKLHNLSLGYSGISEAVFDRLLEFAAKDLVPAVPSKGSLGASGDLAPLAHMSLPLIGKGKFWNRTGTEIHDAPPFLKAHALEPIKLKAKDGLALCNGTQMMAGYGAFVLNRALTLLKTADLVGAMSLEALQGSLKPFDERVQTVRPHPGQKAVAENVRLLLSESEILDAHRQCGKVQDPYSLRCMPQVHGASRDALRHAIEVLEIELNSVTDNPIVFEDGSILSCGNFHGQPLALALDYAAIALAELANISERRIYLLLEGHDGLPVLLMQDTGLNSGFMITQYTAAALVSENKVLCHPASVDSIPTCLGQEDHVSMGSIAAVKLLKVLGNVEHVLAIELMTAAQALDYRLPLRPGRGVDASHKYLRSVISHREGDSYFKDEIETCVDLIRKGSIVAQAEQSVGVLH